MWPYKTCWYME